LSSAWVASVHEDAGVGAAPKATQAIASLCIIAMPAGWCYVSGTGTWVPAARAGQIARFH